MRKEQKEKEPVENEEKNMATATPQALMSKLLLQPVVGQDEFGKETEGDACRAASHRCGQQGEQHDCSDCRCWARKKGKGTEEVPEEPPYTDAAAEAFVPAAVLGQDKTEKYYYVAPVMEMPEEPPHALVAKGDKQI